VGSNPRLEWYYHEEWFELTAFKELLSREIEKITKNACTGTNQVWGGTDQLHWPDDVSTATTSTTLYGLINDIIPKHNLYTLNAQHHFAPTNPSVTGGSWYMIGYCIQSLDIVQAANGAC